MHVSSQAIRTELTADSLNELATRRIAVIHVRSYYPRDAAEEAGKKSINHASLGLYEEEHARVGRIHMPLFDTRSGQDLLAEYHSRALDSILDIRKLFQPFLSPIDKLRLDLEELWPAGASLLRLGGKPCFVGTVRVFPPAVAAFGPHNDEIGRETDAAEAQQFSEQLAANVYLQNGELGGELLLWLREPTTEESEYIERHEGLDPDTIEAPVLEIHPAAGDLILFSARMLHAVRTPQDAHRVNTAAFIGVSRAADPLVYWS
ncbi:hypothetical protein ACIA5E_18225 [Nocardia asteroides]|uniref:2OG-Fe(II)-dependent halogenase WelO5 family protein n=1 Tax=Nocardia asteroides TaxID=1824 RepID=UPI0037BC777E